MSEIERRDVPKPDQRIDKPTNPCPVGSPPERRDEPRPEHTDPRK